MDRRQFGIGLAGAAGEALARPAALARPTGARTLLYSSAGSRLSSWELDAKTATLTERARFDAPSVVQYGWAHPTGQTLYLATSDSARGSAGITGTQHSLTALNVGLHGNLSLHGTPVRLRQRPIHTSVDRSGEFILTCYNAPPHLTVHRLSRDGLIGTEVEQGSGLDLGVFCHQILTLPSNRAVVMVTRGNAASHARPQGDPGALKLFDFAGGRLSNRSSITPGGKSNPDYGPRHLDFHPTKPWVYVLVELQNHIHMHRLDGDTIASEPAYRLPVTERDPTSGIVQVAGAIHVHPKGHVVYASNRVSATTSPNGSFPFAGGENSIAVFALDPKTGRPHPIQFADPHGFHIRAFAIDPTGTVLIAASLAPMVSQGTFTPAGLSLFRIAPDGRLTFVRKYPIELASGVQQMWVQATASPRLNHVLQAPQKHRT